MSGERRAIHNSDALTPLRPRSVTGAYITWRLVPPRGEESCRWERIDGHWVSLTLDAAGGVVIVADAAGRRQPVASYEGALDLAKTWRE